MKGFDFLRGLLRDRSSDSARLADGVEKAKAALAEADALVAQLKADGRKIVAASDSVRADHKAKVAAAAEAREDADALLAELEERLREARAAEAEAGRVARYRAAVSAAEAAKAELQKRYPALAKSFLTLQRTIAEARAAVVAANNDLPLDAPPITDPEAAVRDLPALKYEVLAERIERCWAFSDGSAIIAEGAKIRDEGGGRGTYTHSDSGATYSVVRRQATVTEYLPSEQGQFGPRLATMDFPPLRAGSPRIWSGARPEHTEAILAQVASAKPEGVDRRPRERERSQQLIPLTAEAPPAT